MIKVYEVGYYDNIDNYIPCKTFTTKELAMEYKESLSEAWTTVDVCMIEIPVYDEI